MKLAVIIPAYNEEEFLPITLQSLLGQSRQVDKIVIVNDGSVDGTEGICKAYSETYAHISFISNIKKEKRASGAKVVRAFNLGLKQVSLKDYELIAKIDADIEFPADYFEKVILAFENDNKLGLFAGVCTILKNGEWVYENVANLDHVRGPIKTYRTEAFLQMNGLRQIMGWDTIDELLLRYNGWRVDVDPDLKVKHYRVTHSINGWYKESKLNGQVFHNLGYNFFVAAMSSAKRAITRQPYLLTGLVSFLSYIGNKFKDQPVNLDKMERRFINRYRLKNVGGKNRSTS